MINFQTTFHKDITQVPLNVPVTKVLAVKLDFRHSLYKERKFTGVACLAASLYPKVTRGFSFYVV
jgi:hypothetical protein